MKRETTLLMFLSNQYALHEGLCVNSQVQEILEANFDEKTRDGRVLFYFYITYFAHSIDFFRLTNFAKITNLSCMVSLWCDSWF